MANVICLPFRPAAARAADMSSRPPGATAEIVILPCIRRERLDRPSVEHPEGASASLQLQA